MGNLITANIINKFIHAADHMHLMQYHLIKYAMLTEIKRFYQIYLLTAFEGRKYNPKTPQRNESIT